MYKCAVIGSNVDHSLSPNIYKYFARQLEIELEYLKINTNFDDFENLIRNLMQEKFIGCNITAPFKNIAAIISDEVSEDVTISKAANTLFFNTNFIRAYNTDGLGFIYDLQNLGIVLREKNILLLGAGGAAAGILPYILRQNPSEVLIVNNNALRAEKLIEQNRIICNSIDMQYKSFKDLCKIRQKSKKFDIIIHATSCHSIVNFLTADIMHKDTVLYDLQYAYQQQTSLQQWGKKLSLHVYDGTGMLWQQAAIAFYIWFNYKPSIK